MVPPFQRGGGFGTLGSSFLEPSLPAQVSLAPATWGAWLSIALVVVAIAALVVGIVKHHTRRRHRRVATRELAQLQRGWAGAGGEARIALLERLPRVLKGCALGSFERARVAPLAGAAWLDFLRSTAPGAGFEGAPGEALLCLCERGASALEDSAVPALFIATQRWIARHRV
ncbi:MAG TPA: DUF4381 domain-containing protein [Polyangiales bacterium]